MATKTTLTPASFTTEWNGTDAFTNVQELVVPSGATHLCVRLVINSATMPSITFNGAPLAQQEVGDDTNARACAIFTLTAPDVGTFDLIVNSGVTSRSIKMLVDVISGASGVGVSDSSGGYAANRSLTLATAVGDLVLDILNSALTATVGAGQTADLLNTSNTSASNETATTTSTVMSWTHAADFTSQAAIVFTDGATGPSISSTTDPTVDGVQSSITTSGLTGTSTATLGGYPLSLSGTLPNLTYTTDIASITANGPVSVPRIGDSLTLSVTGDEGEATSAVATQAASGMAVVTLAGTLADETNSLIDKMQVESGLTIAVGDILYYSTANNTNIDATGFLTTDAESIDLLLIQGGDATTAGNGYAFTITPETAVDTSPTAFTFTDVTGQALSTVVESDTVTVLGVDAATDIPVSIVGGEYAVDTGSGFGGWTSANTNVQLNHQIKVRVTTSASDVTGASATLTVGGVSDTFTATTGDFTAPVITLTDGDVTVNQDSVWSDPGFSATDAVDGDVTADVVVTGTIDTSTLGEQVLTYTVSDAAGNETSDTRTVTVQEAPDTTDPVVVAPADITLEFPFGFSGLGQGSSNVQAWLNSATATDNRDGSLAVSNNLGGQVDPLTTGEYTVTFTATDAAGNSGTDTAILTVVEADEPVASEGDVWNMGRANVKARKLVKARTKVSAFKL